MTIIDALSRQLARAEEWDEAAEHIRRFDPQDPKAKVLTACATELREDVEAARPRWVRLTVIGQWSGWSSQTLQRRCRDEWEPEGRARLDDSGRWEVAWETAVGVPRKAVSPDDLAGESPEAIVDAFWRAAV